MSANCDILDTTAIPNTVVSGNKSKHKKHRKKGNAEKTSQNHIVDIHIGFPNPTSMVISMTSDADNLHSILPISKKLNSNSIKLGTNPLIDYHPAKSILSTTEIFASEKRDKLEFDNTFMVGQVSEDLYQLHDSVSKKFQKLPKSELTTDNLLNLNFSCPEKEDKVVNKILFPSPQLQKHNLLSNCDEIISTLNNSGYSTEDWKTRPLVSDFLIFDNEKLGATDSLLQSKHDWKEVPKQKGFGFVNKRSSEILLNKKSDLSISNLLYFNKSLSNQTPNCNVLSTNEPPLFENFNILELPKYSNISSGIEKNKSSKSSNLNLGRRTSGSQSKLNWKWKGSNSFENISQVIPKKKVKVTNREQQVYSVFNVPNFSSLKRRRSSRHRTQIPNSSTTNSKGSKHIDNQCIENSKLSKNKKVDKLKSYNSVNNRRSQPLETNKIKHKGLLSKNSVAESHSTGHHSISNCGECCTSKTSPKSRQIDDKIRTYEILKNYYALSRIDSGSTKMQAFVMTKTDSDDDWDTNSQDFSTAHSMISSRMTNRSAISKEDAAPLYMEVRGSGNYRSNFSIPHPSRASILPLAVYPDCMTKKRIKCPGRTQQRDHRCHARNPGPEKEANSDISDKCQNSKENILGSANAPNGFTVTHSSLFGPTIDDVIHDVICSSSIKGDEYWKKLKNSLNRFRKTDKKINKNECCMRDSSNGNGKNVKDYRNGCQCEPKRDVELSNALLPRQDGCQCDSAKKCQLERRKVQECICSKLHKGTTKCICGSVNTPDTKDRLQENNTDNIASIIPENICNSCIFETNASHFRDILGPTLDDSVLSCINFFTGRGKDMCKKQFQNKIESSQTKIDKITSIPTCPGDLSSWIQNEYVELAEDVKKAKGQVCPGGPLRKDILEARQRALNDLSDLLETKRELEYIGNAHDFDKEFIRHNSKDMKSTSEVGNKRHRGGFDIQMEDYITSASPNQYKHITNLVAKRGSLPFSPMSSLKEVMSNIDDDTEERELYTENMERGTLTESKISLNCKGGCCGERNRCGIPIDISRINPQKYRSEMYINSPRKAYNILTSQTQFQADQLCQSVSEINLYSFTRGNLKSQSSYLRCACCRCHSDHGRGYDASSSSEDIDECPCNPLRYTCSNECRAYCNYPFPGEECNTDCMGKCNYVPEAKGPPRVDKESTAEESVREEFVPLVEIAPSTQLMDRDTNITASFLKMYNKDKSTATDAKDFKEELTSVSNLITKSSKITQTPGVVQKDTSTSFIPSHVSSVSDKVTKSSKIIQTPGINQIDTSTSITPSHVSFVSNKITQTSGVVQKDKYTSTIPSHISSLKTSELEPVKPTFDGDSCLPTCIKYRKPGCSPNCIKYAVPLDGIWPCLNEVPSGRNLDIYPPCPRYGGGEKSAVEEGTMPDIMNDGSYPVHTEFNGDGDISIPRGDYSPDPLLQGDLYPQRGNLDIYPPCPRYADGGKSTLEEGTMPNIIDDGSYPVHTEFNGDGDISIPRGDYAPDPLVQGDLYPQRGNLDIYPQPQRYGGDGKSALEEGTMPNIIKDGSYPMHKQFSGDGGTSAPEGDSSPQPLVKGDLYPQDTRYGNGTVVSPSGALLPDHSRIWNGYPEDPTYRGGGKTFGPDLPTGVNGYPQGTRYDSSRILVPEGGPSPEFKNGGGSFPKGLIYADGDVSGPGDGRISDSTKTRRIYPKDTTYGGARADPGDGRISDSTKIRGIYPKDTTYGGARADPGDGRISDSTKTRGIYPKDTTYGGARADPGDGRISDSTKTRGIYPKDTTYGGAGHDRGRGTPSDKIIKRNGYPKSAILGDDGVPGALQGIRYDSGEIFDAGGGPSPEFKIDGGSFPKGKIYRGGDVCGPGDGRICDSTKTRGIYPKDTTYGSACPCTGSKTSSDKIKHRNGYPKRAKSGDGGVPCIKGGISRKVTSRGGDYPDTVGGKTPGGGRGGRRRIIICNPNRIYGRRSDSCNKYNCPGSNVHNKKLPPVLENAISATTCRNEFCGLHHKAETDAEDCGCPRVRSVQIESTKRIRSSKCIKNRFSLPVIRGHNSGQRWCTRFFSKSTINTRITKVLWAVTRINIFQDESKTYEVMAATEEPPKYVPQTSESVFVVIPNKCKKI